MAARMMQNGAGTRASGEVMSAAKSTSPHFRPARSSFLPEYGGAEQWGTLHENQRRRARHAWAIACRLSCMTKTKRTAISKKTRFDVFKRDAFECQYCGSHPPGVLLHVDHIRPVSDGGQNDIDNLVTACEPCNQGKGARALDVVPETLAAKAAAIAEREAQIAGYAEIMEAKRDRIEDDLWRVAEVVDPGSSKLGMKRDWTASIRRFNERLGLYAVLEAADVARGHYPYGGKRTFLYFCGICWKLVRKQDDDKKES